MFVKEIINNESHLCPIVDLIGLYFETMICFCNTDIFGFFGFLSICGICVLYPFYNVILELICSTPRIPTNDTRFYEFTPVITINLKNSMLTSSNITGSVSQSCLLIRIRLLRPLHCHKICLPKWTMSLPICYVHLPHIFLCKNTNRFDSAITVDFTSGWCDKYSV